MNDISLTAKQDTQDSLRFLKRPINENGNLTFSESGEERLLVSLTAWEGTVGRRSEVPRSANKRRSRKVSSRETRLVMGEAMEEFRTWILCESGTPPFQRSQEDDCLWGLIWRAHEVRGHRDSALAYSAICVRSVSA